MQTYTPYNTQNKVTATDIPGAGTQRNTQGAFVLESVKAQAGE